MRLNFFIFLILCLFIPCYVSALDWNGNLTYRGEPIPKDDISSWRNESDIDKTISKICIYEQGDRHYENNNDLDYTKILYIYSDETASVAWIASANCERNAKGNRLGWMRCNDGTKKNNKVIRGLRNWSKNPDGINSKLKGKLDAYEAYKKNGECPAYMVQAEDGRSNYFYLSTSSRASSFNEIKRKAESEPGSKTYSYYNVGENANFSSDLTCSYSDEKDSDEKKFDVIFSKDGYAKTDNWKDSQFTFRKEDHILKGLEINSRIESKSYLKMIKNERCPKTLDACVYWHNSFLFISSAIHNWSNVQIFGDSSISDSFCSSDDSINFYCVGDNCSEDDICQVYDDYKTEILSTIDGYKSNKNFEARKAILDEYNILKEDLNGFCLSALSTLNYAEGNCVSQCIKLTKDIAEWETEAGIRTAGGNDKCNIGISILTMVYNILKWAKYIVPAFIIIFSILDFIKAIAAQNDDDMKKAQGKFVKRLIVAVLLFLLPLIINFLLKTFGMYSSKCDITDLFS